MGNEEMEKPAGGGLCVGVGGLLFYDFLGGLDFLFGIENDFFDD